LVVRSGEHTGRTIRLDPGIVLGRGQEASIRLPDQKMSRRHAQIEQRRSRIELVDLGSFNGSFVNGKRVRRRKALRSGDVVELGRTAFEVVDGEAMAGATSAEAAGEGRVERRLPTRDLMDSLERTPPEPPGVTESGVGRRDFAIVFNLARRLQEAKSVLEVVTVALDHVFQVTRADRCHIVLRDSASGELEPVLTRYRDPEVESPPQLSRSVLQRVVAERAAVMSSDARADPRFEAQDSVADLSLGCLLCVPILHGTEVTGAIQIDRLSPGEFSRRDFELVTVITSLLGVRLENARLFEEQAETIRALQDAREQLLEKEQLAILGRLTSGLAHSIGNLVTPFGLAKTLGETFRDDPDVLWMAELMIDAEQAIARLLEEVGALARGRRPELEMARHRLDETLESVIAFARCDPRVKRHHIELRDEGVPPFVFDEDGIKQVTLNLIRNAAQAMAKPGHVRIRLAPDEADPSRARLEVSDNGSGIPPDVLAHIWEPFFTTKGKGGMGLGLDISRRIVKDHGGEIRCQTEVGAGTTMIVLLPLDLPLSAGDEEDGGDSLDSPVPRRVRDGDDDAVDL
jgi:signal transduction histidine kinase